MKLKFVLFATIKNVDKHIETYQTISSTLRDLGCEMIEPWLVDNYPSSQEEKNERMQTLIHNTNKVVNTADFAVADFSEKSRTVFFQSVTALEKKLPILCLINENEYENFPERIMSIGGNLVTVKKYVFLRELNEILIKYLEDLQPPSVKMTTLIKRSTLNQADELCKELDISKSELIKRVIAKEHRRVFE